VEGWWGEANNTFLTGENLFAMTFDNFHNLLVINLNPTNQDQRRPNIALFNRYGIYMGVFITNEYIGKEIPLGITVDKSDDVWIVTPFTILKYDSNGNFLKNWKPQYCSSGTQILASVRYHEDMVYIGVICDKGPHDYVVAIDMNGNVVNTIQLQGKTGGGTPAALLFDSKENLFVCDSDAENIGAQHIQVYNKGILVNQFGGNQCSEAPPNYLCQPFNGLEFVPM